MFSPVQLLKLSKPLRHSCPQNQPLVQNTERIEYKIMSLTYNTLQSSQPSCLRQLFPIQPPTCSSKPSSSTLALLRPSVTSSQKCVSIRSIAIHVAAPSFEETPPVLATNI